MAIAVLLFEFDAASTVVMWIAVGEPEPPVDQRLEHGEGHDLQRARNHDQGTVDQRLRISPVSAKKIRETSTKIVISETDE